MAHMISQVGSISEMFVAGEPAWHGLGQNVNKAKSWKEAVKLAHLNWSVDKLQLLSPAGQAVAAWGMFRSDNGAFLGPVGSKYTPIQNVEMLEFMDTLVEADEGAYFESAGALDKGERIWGLIRIPEAIKIKGTDDISDTYLLGYNRHDGKEKNKYKHTSIRVVCNNTLQQALSFGDDELALRHTAGVHDKMEAAKKIFCGINQEVRTLNDKLNFLNSKKMTTQTMGDILRRLFPKIEDSKHQQNMARDILVNFESNDRNAFPQERGTALNFLNAVTQFVDHGSFGVKIGDPAEAVKNFEIPDALFQKATEEQQKEVVTLAARRQSAMFGRGDEFKSETLDAILELTQWAPTPAVKTSASPVDSIMAMISN